MYNELYLEQRRYKMNCTVTVYYSGNFNVENHRWTWRFHFLPRIGEKVEIHSGIYSEVTSIHYELDGSIEIYLG